jgi:hypothetical protein
MATDTLGLRRRFGGQGYEEGRSDGVGVCHIEFLFAWWKERTGAPDEPKAVRTSGYGSLEFTVMAD